jgi:hypothetical protein
VPQVRARTLGANLGLRPALRTLPGSGAGNRPSAAPARLALGVRAERFAIRTNFPVKAHTTGRLAKLADDGDSENRVQRRKREQDRGRHTALSAPATVLNRQTSVCDVSHKATTAPPPATPAGECKGCPGTLCNRKVGSSTSPAKAGASTGAARLWPQGN